MSVGSLRKFLSNMTTLCPTIAEECCKDVLFEGLGLRNINRSESSNTHVQAKLDDNFFNDKFKEKLAKRIRINKRKRTCWDDIQHSALRIKPSSTTTTKELKSAAITELIDSKEAYSHANLQEVCVIPITTSTTKSEEGEESTNPIDFLNMCLRDAGLEEEESTNPIDFLNTCLRDAGLES